MPKLSISSGLPTGRKMHQWLPWASIFHLTWVRHKLIVATYKGQELQTEDALEEALRILAGAHSALGYRSPV